MVWGSGLNVTSGYTAMNRRFLWSFRELLMRKLKMSLESEGQAPMCFAIPDTSECLFFLMRT